MFSKSNHTSQVQLGCTHHMQLMPWKLRKQGPLVGPAALFQQRLAVCQQRPDGRGRNCGCRLPAGIHVFDGPLPLLPSPLPDNRRLWTFPPEPPQPTCRAAAQSVSLVPVPTETYKLTFDCLAPLPVAWLG